MLDSLLIYTDWKSAAAIVTLISLCIGTYLIFSDRMVKFSSAFSLEKKKITGYFQTMDGKRTNGPGVEHYEDCYVIEIVNKRAKKFSISNIHIDSILTKKLSFFKFKFDKERNFSFPLNIGDSELLILDLGCDIFSNNHNTFEIIDSKYILFSWLKLKFLNILIETGSGKIQKCKIDSIIKDNIWSKWRENAACGTGKKLYEHINKPLISNHTLLQLGKNIVADVLLESINNNEWNFKLIGIQVGSYDLLNKYALEFKDLELHEKFVVMESPGDARSINFISLQVDGSSYHVHLKVDKKENPTNPSNTGNSSKISDDGDWMFGSRISGKELAVQNLMISMGTAYGENIEHPHLGTKVADYYKLYSNDLTLLSRLVKLEFIRLSLIKGTGDNEKRSLPFVKEFKSITVDSKELSNSRLSVEVELIWGDETVWIGFVKIYVGQ